jgi:undecaprenyl diphosphate synthase
MDDTELLPKHIGIIMDGNGRWAIKRKLPRTAGHKEGLDAAKVFNRKLETYRGRGFLPYAAYQKPSSERI